MIINVGSGNSSVSAEDVKFNDTMDLGVDNVQSAIEALGGASESEVLATFYEPNTVNINTAITDYKFIYIELMLSGLSVSSRLIPVSRMLYGRRFNVSFNNDLTFYNGQVGFSDANTISCGILQSADMLAVYGVK